VVLLVSFGPARIGASFGPARDGRIRASGGAGRPARAVVVAWPVWRLWTHRGSLPWCS